MVHSFVWLSGGQGVEAGAGRQVTKWDDRSHAAKFSHRHFSEMSEKATTNAYRYVEDYLFHGNTNNSIRVCSSL